MAKKTKRKKKAPSAAQIAYYNRNKKPAVDLAAVADTPTRTTYKLPVLNERETTHGDYRTNAAISQGIKQVTHAAASWPSLTADKQESLDLAATKIGRILAGNASDPEHWRDLAGYATLVAEWLEQNTP